MKHALYTVVSHKTPIGLKRCQIVKIQSIALAVSELHLPESISQSVGQSVSRSVSQSVGQSVGRSVSRSVSQSVSQSVSRKFH